MPDPQWENLKEIFHAAVALPQKERAAYLDQACGENQSVRVAVESLLKSHEESDNFVDVPAYKVAETLLEDQKFGPSDVIGHYRILSLLGEGGMGKVYLAQDTKLHRKVSLKFVSTSFDRDREQWRRFQQEARVASALNHPNILTIHEIGQVDGREFIAAEFIEGQTLRERLNTDLDIEEILDIAIQIASALVAAHRSNIIHRDLKPENIMIRKDDGLVKVLDFGLAKMNQNKPVDGFDSSVQTIRVAKTEPGVIMGTVAYMSPEQARGQTVDERTDIWSLGVVLYEMITGCPPFLAGSSHEIMAAILAKEPAYPLTCTSGQLPARLEKIVEKALTKNRDERYQTTNDLLNDLKSLRQTLEMKASAATSSSVEYIFNNVKRHKLGVIAALTVLLFMIVGTFIYSLRSRQASVAPTEIRSLAVLPLKSFDSGENYLGLGIADAVILRISQTGKLIVRPTSAVRRYLNEDTDGLAAAKQLGVDSVLEGTVQRANDRLRISVNLLRTIDGISLWSDTFDLRTADIFAIQDTISQQVASRLQLQLDGHQQARLGKRYTSNPEAYEYYLKGRTNFERISTSIGDREPTEAAISYFKKAVELDPTFALAYAMLGSAYMWMANFNDPDNPVWVDRAQQALAQAESLDPQLAEIHDARFQYYFSKYGNWDLAQAAREVRQALALDPSVGHGALGIIYDHIGLDEATGLRAAQRALEIDPTNTSVQARLVESYELYGKFDEAIDRHHRFFGTVGPTYALISEGRLDDAQPLLEEAIKKNSGDLRSRARLALLNALKGKFQEAEAAIPLILKEARNNRSYHHITYDIACLYALAGKTDDAIKWLRTTTETGMPNYALLARDPHLDRIRKEPAFIQLMAELQPRWEGFKKEFE